MVWICKFPNWSSCEERAYYNWECKADIDQDTKENTLENTDKNEKNLENELELNKQKSDNNIDDITENEYNVQLSSETKSQIRSITNKIIGFQISDILFEEDAKSSKFKFPSLFRKKERSMEW